MPAARWGWKASRRRSSSCWATARSAPESRHPRRHFRSGSQRAPRDGARRNARARSRQAAVDAHRGAALPQRAGRARRGPRRDAAARDRGRAALRDRRARACPGRFGLYGRHAARAERRARARYHPLPAARRRSVREARYLEQAAGGRPAGADRGVLAPGLEDRGPRDSTRQVKALADHVQEKVRENGVRVYGVEGEASGEWVLVDLGDVVVHIMHPTVRDFYNLEEVWGGKTVQFQRKKPERRGKAARSRRKRSAA